MRYPRWMVLVLLVVLVSCTDESGNSQPLINFVNSTPEDTLRQFLDAWNTKDIDTMYGLIAPQSQNLYAPDAFKNRYQQADDTMGFEGVTYTFTDVHLQGNSAAIQYDVTIQSPTFGDIDDLGRITRLIKVDGMWKVAWSTMDILTGLAEEVRLQVDSNLPRRANIYDRNGLPLAEQDGTIKWIAVIRQDMPDEEECVRLLARLLLRSRVQLRQIFASYNPDTLFQVGEMDVQVFNTFESDLNAVCGLNVGGFPKSGEYISRHYYGQGATTHAVGYMGSIAAEQVAIYQARGYSESDLVGLAGVEQSYQDVLAGKPEKTLRMVDSSGSVLRELGGKSGSDPTPIKLTLDRELQQVTAQALNDAFNVAEINWASVSSGAAAVVIDVRTGEILALASYPTFDPSLFNRENNTYEDPLTLIAQLNTDRRVPLSNKAVQEQYTPGSIYKLINALAALDTGTWTPDAPFDCTLEWRGQEKYGDSLAFRQDWRVADELPAAGIVTIKEAIATSCNPYFWEMGAMMWEEDPNLLVRYSEMFGLGRRVGMSTLGQEAAGNVAPPLNSTQAINNAIGQGDVQLNPLQFTMSIAAIANKGTLWKPYIVSQEGGFDGVPIGKTFTSEVANTITLPDLVWDTVHEGMCLAVTHPDLGTARFAFEDVPYSVCGKTGTAETGARGSSSPPHGWFVSFSPSDNPQIATLVVVTNGREGSETAAPITRRILDYYYSFEAFDFPPWWTTPYVPVAQPEGVTG